MLGWSFSHDLRPAFDAQAWANLGGMGDINTQVQLVYEIAGNAALLAASAMLVGLMLARRRVVRALYPSYLIFRWIFVLADTAWTAAAGNAETPGAAPVIGFAVGMLLPVIIWVAYFRKSRRVWNTFIR